MDTRLNNMTDSEFEREMSLYYSIASKRGKRSMTIVKRQITEMRKQRAAHQEAQKKE